MSLDSKVTSQIELKNRATLLDLKADEKPVVIRNTSAPYAPGYSIPADDKPSAP